MTARADGAAPLALEVAGEALQALPDRALHWPRARTLIVADVHLGKSAAFRRLGVPVPSGATQADLARLDVLLTAIDAERLLVLGDLFHTAPLAGEAAVTGFAALRAAHRHRRFMVIAGNHDRAWRALPQDWDMTWHTQALHEPPFVFQHAPGPDARGYALGGHIHPCVRLKVAGDAARLPVFWFGANVGVLPSFGSFTGGYNVQPARGDVLVAVTPHGLARL